MARSGGTKKSRARKGVRKPSEAINAAQEAFCQHYALHKNGAEAVRHAWPQTKRKTNQYVAERASKLLAIAKIRARVEQLSDKVVEKAERRFDITTDWVLQRTAAIAGASLEDFVSVGKDGQPYIDVAKADNVALRGLSGLEITRREILPPTVLSGAPGEAAGDGEAVAEEASVTTKTKLRLPERAAALRLLGQHLKMWGGENETVVNVNLSDRLRKKLEVKRKRSGGSGSGGSSAAAA